MFAKLHTFTAVLTGLLREHRRRSCVGRSTRSAMKSSVARSELSKKSSQDVGLGERITCSPSLRMYTSVPSKRNSAGRRTAWLRPLLKSLAVWFAMSILQNRNHSIYHDITLQRDLRLRRARVLSGTRPGLV